MQTLEDKFTEQINEIRDEFHMLKRQVLGYQIPNSWIPNEYYLHDDELEYPEGSDIWYRVIVPRVKSETPPPEDEQSWEAI